MRYNTGNPVGPDGSSSPFDLHDNAANIDVWANDRSRMTWPDRLGVSRKTWAGLEQQVTDYLIAQGYEPVYLIYGAGVIVERQTQLVQKDGELYRAANAEDLPLTLSGDWATDAPKLQAVGDQALRQLLSSPGGDNYVRHDSSETVNQAIEWRTVPTVEKYGAEGWPHDDTAAFQRMFDATGMIIMQARRYKIPNLLIDSESVVMIGARCPAFAPDGSTLVGGTVIEGTILFRTNNGFFRNFGCDTGPATGADLSSEGFVSDARVGARGVHLHINNIATLGPGPLSISHACLFEGYDSFDVSDVHIGGRNYGVVCKSRNGTIRNVVGRGIAEQCVFVKSDTPDVAGNVADGTASNVRVSGVLNYVPVGAEYANSTACTVMSSSAILTNVHVDGVVQNNGRAGLVVQGGLDGIYTVGVTFDQIVANDAYTIVECGGTTYDTHGGMISGSNYSSGHLFRVGVLNSNWRIDSALGIISVTTITTTEAFLAYGTGSWGHVQVRNGVTPGGQVAPQVTGVSPGTVSGDVHFQSDGLLPMQNGWATTDAKATTSHGRVSLSGTVDAASATSEFIVTTKLAFPTDIQYYTVPSEKSGVWGTATVRVWVNGVVLLSPALSSDLKIHLSGIGWQIS